jgi:uncharacterized membrane protein
MKEKLKNYGLWISFAALTLLFLQDAGIAISPDKFNLYVNSLLGILVLLGIVSDPKSGKFFVDNKEGKDKK